MSPVQRQRYRDAWQEAEGRGLTLTIENYRPVWRDRDGRQTDELGRLLDLPMRECVQCAEPFEATDPRRRYCSASCRKAAFVARRRQG